MPIRRVDLQQKGDDTRMQPDPISEGWIARGAPIDHLSTHTSECAVCGDQTTQDRYRVILGGWGGLGAPFFVRAFTRRSSTKGKIGKKSVWDFCLNCRSFLPHDDAARDEARGLGLPFGFTNQPA